MLIGSFACRFVQIVENGFIGDDITVARVFSSKRVNNFI